MRGDGRGYSGSIYRTKSGDICQMWSQQTPHPHPMLPELYRSDLDHAGFSCRNPGVSVPSRGAIPTTRMSDGGTVTYQSVVSS